MGWKYERTVRAVFLCLLLAFIAIVVGTYVAFDGLGEGFPGSN